MKSKLMKYMKLIDQQFFFFAFLGIVFIKHFKHSKSFEKKSKRKHYCYYVDQVVFEFVCETFDGEPPPRNNNSAVICIHTFI